MKQHTITTICIIALAIAVIVLAFNFHSGEDKTISVSGMAELEVISDEATINLGIVTTEIDSKTTESNNAKIANKVIVKLKEIVGEKNIETTSYNIYENRDWDYVKQVYNDNGYKATHNIKVTTTDLDNVGELIQIAMDEGATNLNGISFGLSKSKEKELRAEALDKAIEVAKQKAEAIAKTTDVRIKSVKTVTENNYHYTPFEYANVRMDGLEGSSKSADIQPQSLTVQSSVSVVYEIN